MKKVLVTYATFSGSTAEVASAIAEALRREDRQIDVRPLAQAGSPDDSSAVVLGAPMIMGWHREAMNFLKKNRNALQRMPLAIFVTAMSLTSIGEIAVEGVPVFMDDGLAKPPQKPGRLSFRERYTLVSSYAAPILKAARPAKPVSIAFFAGRLDLFRLKWWAMLFVMLIVQAQIGDRRNWEAIHSWARELPV